MLPWRRKWLTRGAFISLIAMVGVAAANVSLLKDIFFPAETVTSAEVERIVAAALAQAAAQGALARGARQEGLYRQCGGGATIGPGRIKGAHASVPCPDRQLRGLCARVIITLAIHGVHRDLSHGPSGHQRDARRAEGGAASAGAAISRREGRLCLR